MTAKRGVLTLALQGNYSNRLKVREKHLPSVYALDYGYWFAAPSIVLVNIATGSGSRTNLIVEDDLSQVFEKFEQQLEQIGIVLEVDRKSLLSGLVVQQPKLTLKVVELAGRNSAPSTTRGTIAYHIISLQLFCSVTSSGCGSGRFSNADKRERRSSILFPTGIVSWRWVRQRTLGSKSQANFVISVNNS